MKTLYVGNLEILASVLALASAFKYKYCLLQIILKVSYICFFLNMSFSFGGVQPFQKRNGKDIQQEISKKIIKSNLAESMWEDVCGGVPF